MINIEDLNQDNLSSYGSIFQYKVISLLLTDKMFFEQVFDILDSSLFESNSLQWIIRNIKQYYVKYHKLPEIESFKIFFKKDGIDSNLKYQIVRALDTAYRYRQASDLELVKEETREFLKNRNLANVILESIELLKLKKYDEIKEKIDDALKAGEDFELGHDYKNDIDNRYNADKRITIPTGYAPLDECLDGGLGKKELGVILAMSSVGKTWLLCHIALNAIKRGKSVVFYNLEDTDTYVGTRIDSIMLGISTHDLKYHIEKIKKQTEKLSGSLIIKDYPSEFANINHFRSHISRLRMLGKDPDMVIIDYGDIIGTVKKFREDWLNQRQAFQEIKSLAQVEDIPIWTASQANNAEGEDVIKSSNMQRSYAKVAPCNVILGLSRKIEDKLTGTGRLHIAKNKFGPDGITFPCKIDNDKGLFKIYSENSKIGKSLLQQMENGGEVVKDRIRKSFKEFTFSEK